jgi:2-polyprenyl-3-methyl-5-hydroxy-6-metoxy-1,4-benzoquinol methylase
LCDGVFFDYQGLELIGVDINPISVERARSQFQRVNLSYEVGDISDMVFPAQSLDGILDSSVLHHVTSFNDFDVNRVLVTLDNQTIQVARSQILSLVVICATDPVATAPRFCN